MDQRRNERSGDRDRRYGIAGDRRQFLGRACIIAPRENGIERLAKYSASRAVLFGSSEDPEQRLARALARAAGWPRLRWRVARDVEHGGDEIDAGRRAFAGSTSRGLTSIMTGSLSATITSIDNAPCQLSAATSRASISARRLTGSRKAQRLGSYAEGKVSGPFGCGARRGRSGLLLFPSRSRLTTQ
jgi:hypothetical protein